MKRLLTALALIATMAFASHAQKAEFYVGYGGYTQMDASDCADDWSTDNAWGAVTAGFNFNVAPKFSIGPSYTFSSQSLKHNDGNVYYHALMLNAKYNYYRTSIFTLYAHVGLGAVISNISPKHADSYTKGYFAYQVVPIGAQVSIARNVNMFGELGFGAQGLLQVGFRFGI